MADRYLDFESHHPLAHKVAVARTLLTRADRICTDFPDKAREKERVTQALRVNGYPRELVTKNWKPTARPHQPEVSDTPKAKVILPYVRHLSETIRRILTPLGIYTCFRPHHTLRRTLVHLKDPTPLRQRTGVVYRIPCSSCDKVYIGQTGRTLDHRLKEHRRALTSGNVQQSAVAEHATSEMHDIDWEKAEVVDCHPHYRQRCALEAWHIRTEPHKMNRDGGPLPAVYNPLIHHPRRPH